jgi:hypothetical protein
MRIFALKKDEATGYWSKLHNEELHNWYSPPRIIKTMKSRRKRWAKHVARMDACMILVGTPGGKRFARET